MGAFELGFKSVSRSLPIGEMEGGTLQAKELSTFFRQETDRWILMLRLPLAREQMKQSSCLSGILLLAS